MSTKSHSKIPTSTEALYQDAPYVGALLRMTYQGVRLRILEALREQGFTDLNEALLGVFNFPPPDGVQLTELADRMNATKQATNYVVGKLEELGYLERRKPMEGRHRRVYLTRRGWLVFEKIWATNRQLEVEWAAKIGQKKIREFLNVLRQLAPVETSRNLGETARLPKSNALAKGRSRSR